MSTLKHEFCIDGRLLKFLVDYLSDRNQRVVIGGFESDTSRVASGVPQGSILGPLLFVLFINDMVNCVSNNTNIALYADDTKIWREINCWNDHQILQNDINSLHSWAAINKMKFHPHKCKVLRVYKNECQLESILPFLIFFIL